MEVNKHKGNSVLCQAIRKIIREANRSSSTPLPQSRPPLEDLAAELQEVDEEVEVDDVSTGNMASPQVCSTGKTSQDLASADDSEPGLSERVASCSSLSSSSFGSIDNVPGHPCILEVSEEGLRMVDRRYEVSHIFTPVKYFIIKTYIKT